MLFETFPSWDEVMQGIPDNTCYPMLAFKFKPVTNKQVRRAITKLSLLKAPGPNSIPNIVLKQCIDVLLPYIGPLFRATFMLGVYPCEWKDSTTKVL